MTNEFVLEAISREFPDSVISSSISYDTLDIIVKKSDVKKIIHHLRDSSLEINFLTSMCGIHHPEDKENELGMIYFLHNMPHNYRMRIKAYASREEAEFETLTDLYSGANWMEREAFSTLR